MTKQEFIEAGVVRAAEQMLAMGISREQVRASVPILVDAFAAWLARQGQTLH